MIKEEAKLNFYRLDKKRSIYYVAAFLLGIVIGKFVLPIMALLTMFPLFIIGLFPSASIWGGIFIVLQWGIPLFVLIKLPAKYIKKRNYHAYVIGLILSFVYIMFNTLLFI